MKPTAIEKDIPKYSGWHCPYGDMQIMMASQNDVDKHLATHKDKPIAIEKEKPMFKMPTKREAIKHFRKIIKPFCEKYEIDYLKVKYGDLWGSTLQEIKNNGYIYEFTPYMRHSEQKNFMWNVNNPGWERTWKQKVEVRWYKEGHKYLHNCPYCECENWREVRLSL